MPTKDTTTIAITLKNGHCFEHHPPKKSFDKQLAFFNEILRELVNKHGGILSLTEVGWN